MDTQRPQETPAPEDGRTVTTPGPESAPPDHQAPQPQYAPPVGQPPYSQQGQHGYPGQAPYQQPPAQPSQPSQGGYYQQPQGQGAHNPQQGQYPPQYPQQQYQQYPQQYPQNYNAPARKGPPVWLWGLIGLLVVALIGGGILLFALLQPKNQVVSTSATATPRSEAARTPAPQRTPATQRTPVAPPASAAEDTVVSFIGYVQNSRYGEAFDLLHPDFAAETSPEDLESGFASDVEQYGELTSFEVSEAEVDGDMARVSSTVEYESGKTFSNVWQLTEVDGQWLISGTESQ